MDINFLRLTNIVHLTREHHFNMTLVLLHTEHYVLTNTGIIATIILLERKTRPDALIGPNDSTATVVKDVTTLYNEVYLALSV